MRLRAAGSVLSALLMSVMVAATSLVAHAKVQIVHLTYTSHPQTSHDYLKEMAKAFEARHPGVTIDIIIGNQEKFNVMVAAGTPPDVVALPALDLGDLIAREYFVDLRPLLRRDAPRAFTSSILDGQQMPSGGVFLLPGWINVVLTWFNRDMYHAAGLPTPIELGEDWTWDQALNQAKKLTIDKDGNGIPDQFGMDRSYAGYEWAVHQAGGRFYDDYVKPTKSLWNSPEVLTAVRFIRSIFEAGMTSRWRVNNWTDFYFWHNGSAIDIVDQPGIIGAFLNKVSFDWDMALQPKGPHSRATRISVEGYMIPKATNHLDWTWEWLKFIAVDETNARRFMQVTGLVPALTALQPEYKDVARLGNKNWRVIFENTLAPNSFPGYFVDQRLNPRAFMGPITEVWSGQVSPEVWLERTHQQTTAVLAELNRR